MKKLLLLLLAALCGTVAGAQVLLDRQVVASAGISGIAGEVMLQSTLGEVATAAFSSGDVILTEGFQQPEILLIELPPVEGDLITGIILYPNPASVEAQLEFDLLEDSNVQVLLFNNAGQMVYHVQMDASKGRVQHLVPLGGRYAAGMYYLLLKIEYEAHTRKLIIQ